MNIIKYPEIDIFIRKISKIIVLLTSAQSSLTLRPHGLFQARILEWVAISFSKVLC